jgi:hypothetical protein
VEIKLNEVEVTKLNLQPGEVLFVKVKSSRVSSEALNLFGEEIRELFPNNQVVVFGMDLEEDIELTTVKDSSTVEQALSEGE